jgi:hypothetical protein
MANPMYGQNKADSIIGQITKKSIAVNLGTLADNVVLDATDMIIAGMKNYTGGIINVGDSFEFSLINAGTAGADETITVVAGTGITLIGAATVENADSTHDAFSSGSGLFRVQVTGDATCDVIRLA